MHSTCGVPIITEDAHAADPSPTDPPRRDAAEGVSRTSWRVSGRGGRPDEHPVPASQRHCQRAPRRERRYSTPAPGADRLGRTDLADVAVEVGPLACHEGPGTPTKSPPAAQDGVVATSGCAARSRAA